MTVTGTLNAAARETAATVTLSISGGTADAGDDFTVVQDVVLTIPAGSTSGTAPFTLAPIDDSTDEPNETVRVSGTSATSGITVNQPAGGLTVTINDNDDTPEVTLVLTPSSISEVGGTSTVTATLDHPSSQATTITVSVIPLVGADADDYTQTGTTLTIAAEAMTSTGTVTIAANDNQIDHANRQLGDQRRGGERPGGRAAGYSAAGDHRQRTDVDRGDADGDAGHHIGRRHQHVRADGDGDGDAGRGGARGRRKCDALDRRRHGGRRYRLHRGGPPHADGPGGLDRGNGDFRTDSDQRHDRRAERDGAGERRDGDGGHFHQSAVGR